MTHQWKPPMKAAIATAHIPKNKRAVRSNGRCQAASVANPGADGAPEGPSVAQGVREEVREQLSRSQE